MKHPHTPHVAVSLVLSGFVVWFAQGQIGSLWRGQTSTSNTSVSLTVAGAVSSSSAASSASSSAQEQSSSSTARDPYGRYRYSEELTMEKLIPLLRKRFLRPAAPIPEEILPPPPYYRPLRTFPRTRLPIREMDQSLLEFGERVQSDMQQFLLWPKRASLPQTGTETLFFGLRATNPWQWMWEPPVVDNAVEGIHGAAGEPRWQWVRYLTETLGEHAESWMWLLFLVLMLIILLFSRKIMDRIVDALIGVKKALDKRRFARCHLF